MATPFLDEYRFPAEAPPDDRGANGATSPFLSLYRSEAGEQRVDPESEEFVSFVNELQDEELNEALYELANEAGQLHDEAFSGETYSAQHVDGERLLQREYGPALREMERFYDRMSAEFGERDMRRLTDEEIDAAVDRYTPAVEYTPAMENLFGFAKKLVKKVAKKGFDLAKRGVKAVASFGLGQILGRIKPLFMQMVMRVLRMVINKLPPQYRSVAEAIAKRFPGIQLAPKPAPAPPQAVEPAPAPEPAPADTGGGEDNAASMDPAAVQSEFNLQVAEVLFAESLVDQEVAVARYAASAPAPENYSLEELDRARTEFATRVSEMEAGQDVAPHVERFIPAIIPVVKLALKIGGRSRVVGAISEIVAGMLGQFVGKDKARPLAQLLVDRGLKLMNLETTPEEEMQAGGDALALTVEETVRRVADLPEYILENRALLEGFVVEAFEQAAGAHLPVLSEDVYARRPDLQEVHGRTGFWVLRPKGRGPKSHKRFTLPFEIAIQPHMAQAVMTFGGVPLAAFLRDRLGQAPGATLKARVHLFEAIPGTTLHRICRMEKGIPGLGPGRYVHLQLHPLTTAAAGMLLGQPRLGRNFKGPAERRAMRIGERVYYLEIPGAHLRVQNLPGGKEEARRSSHVSVALDFPANRIVVKFFLSEADAQEVAVKLRKRPGPGTVMPALRALLDSRMAAVFSGNAPGRIKIVHPSLSPDLSRGRAFRQVPPVMQEALAKKLTDWVTESTSEFLDRQSQSFLTATEDQKDGVTFTLAMEAPSGLTAVGDALAGKPAVLDDKTLAKPNITAVVEPGFQRV